MKKIMSILRFGLVLFAVVTVTLAAQAQLTCANCSGRDTTSYTNGQSNDSLFFLCQGDAAALRVFWPSGDLRNVQWYRFISVSNTWAPIVNQLQVAQGAYGAGPGGYRAVVTDGSGQLVYDEVCWVSRINSPAIVNANTIQPGCTSVQLSGLYIGGAITGYYNSPPLNFDSAFVFSENSSIELCMNIVHPILSDLSIELVAPSACGSAVVLLTSTQTPTEPDSICFNSDAVGLCFTNASAQSYNLCALPNFDVGGSYGAYGTDAQAIDWSPLVGCDVTEPGWRLNVRDCYGGANGDIVSVSMTISDEANTLSQEFLPAPGQSLEILDTGCDSSLFTSVLLERYYPQSTLLSQGVGIAWEAFPPFDLPNNGIGLNHFINPAPTQDTYFQLRLTGIELGEACGSNSSDIEFYDYIQPDSTVIALTDSVLCITDSALLLTSSISEGSWVGPLDSIAGGVLFNPAAVGPGLWSIAFEPVSSCIEPTEVFVLVDVAPEILLPSATTFCSTEELVDLTAAPNGGVWSGLGVVDALLGEFSPSQVPGNASQLTYSVGGNCPAQDSVVMSIELYTPLQIAEADTTLCENAAPFLFTSNLSFVQWQGLGITSPNLGAFEAAEAVLGMHPVVAVYQQACTDYDTVWVSIEDASIVFGATNPVCVNGSWADLEVEAAEGVWSGNGIVDSLLGVVDPVLLGVGVHYVTYQLGNSCASSDSLAISVEDFPDIQLGLPQGVCVDQVEFALAADVGGGVFSGAGVVLADTQWLFNPQLAGVGSAVVRYDYSDVCSVSVFDSLEVYSLPSLVVAADTAICPEGEALLFVSGAWQYGWAPSSSLLTPQEATTIAQPSSTTTYAVAGESIYGCFSSEEVTVTVFDAPVLTANGPLEMCPGESEVLEVVGITQAQWVGEAVESPLELITTVAPSQTTTYTVTGEDENGCVGSTSVEVIVHQPLAFFSVSDSLAIPPVEVQFTNLSNGDYFVWDFGNGDTLLTTDLNAQVLSVYDGATVHTISLTAYLNGCPSVFSLSIETYYDSELLLVPNIVTPNGDGRNDTWLVETRNMDDLQIDIFNRWGRPVDHLDGIDDRWDPKEFSSGTYYYKLVATGLDGEGYNREGNITVVRSED